MDIHVGALIKQRAKDLRIGPTELGAKINTSKQNVYGIYKRKSIDTRLLMKLCNALSYDFFRLYSESLRLSDGSAPEDDYAKCISEKTLLEREKDVLENENAYLKKINSLLEERFSKEKPE
jgi:DNA-binding Xre family transcriptional regulator